MRIKELEKLTKIKKIFVCLCMAAAFWAVTAGCGKNDNSDPGGSDNGKNTQHEKDADEEPGDTDNGREYKNIKEYLETNADEVEQAEKAAEGSGMAMKITAEGSALVYTMQFENQLDVTPEEAREYFEEVFDARKSQFEDRLNEMKELISDKNVSIILRYLDADGTGLFEGNIAGTEALQKDGKQYKDIAEYVRANADEIEGAEKEAEGSGMTMKITTGGSALVYTLQFEEQLDVTPEAAREYFEKVFDTQKGPLEDSLREMKELISDKDVFIIFRYLDADGTELFSGEVK